MDWTKVWTDFAQARELRFRPGQPLWASFPWGEWQGRERLTPEDILQAAQTLSGHALAARGEQLAKGFLSLPGGHRLGIAGVMGEKGLREMGSLCLRIAHQVKGCGEALFPQIRGKSTLIIGPPGTGKTTLLRDLIRLYAVSGLQVGVSDERGEIAACSGGVPQLDVGPRTDVIGGLAKEQAVLLLIRSMAPQVIAADEVGGPGDAQALMEAVRCGAIVLATCHGRDQRSAALRPGMRALFERGAFEKAVVLQNIGEEPRLEEWAWEEQPDCWAR